MRSGSIYISRQWVIYDFWFIENKFLLQPLKLILSTAVQPPDFWGNDRICWRSADSHGQTPAQDTQILKQLWNKTVQPGQGRFVTIVDAIVFNHKWNEVWGFPWIGNLIFQGIDLKETMGLSATESFISICTHLLLRYENSQLVIKCKCHDAAPNVDSWK